jgi:glycosyltransferase involved in cell wall biosynthesis
MMPKGKKLLLGKRRLKSCLLQLPSGKWNPFEKESKDIRLLALTMVRDEARFLPGLLRNLAPQVEGIIALDDGSSDGSDRLLVECPQVLQLFRNHPDRSGYDEPGNFRRLVAAALDHGAEWIIAVDADERLEQNFRARAERVIRRGRRLGLRAFQVHVRELWDAPDRYRADGIWGLKWAPRLFQALPGQQYDERPLHGAKAPLQGKVLGVFPLADLYLYHLRMMRREDRENRRRRYETLDPQARCQPELGYAYLTDERGIGLRPVPDARGYKE